MPNGTTVKTLQLLPIRLCYYENFMACLFVRLNFVEAYCLKVLDFHWLHWLSQFEAEDFGIEVEFGLKHALDIV